MMISTGESPDRRALRSALIAVSTAFAAITFHLPQPFLAVLAATLLSPIAPRGGTDFIDRLFAAATGVAAGFLPAVLAQQAPWISLPMFGFFCIFGYRAFMGWRGAACGVLFVMGIGGTFPAMWIVGPPGIAAALAHTAALWLAAAGSAFWWLAIPGAVGERGATSAPHAVQAGCAAVITILLSAVALPGQAVVMTIAALTGTLALQNAGKNSNEIAFHLLGAFAGVVISAGFLVVVVTNSNGAAAYLLGLGLCFFCFERFASGSWVIFWRRVAIVFAVCSTMGAAPDIGFYASADRFIAILCGFGISSAIFILAQISPPASREAAGGRVNGRD